MEVTRLEGAAPFSLVEQVAMRLKETNGVKKGKWIPGEKCKLGKL